jgi:hypothetical protein
LTSVGLRKSKVEYHYLSRFEIASEKRISQHLSGIRRECSGSIAQSSDEAVSISFAISRNAPANLQYHLRMERGFLKTVKIAGKVLK